MKITVNNNTDPSSFRDPAGFLFWKDGGFYRQVNYIYREDFDHFVASGLYADLIDEGLIIPHAEVDVAPLKSELAYKVIKSEFIPFISYPYEWCFSQLKNAALTTLAIQAKAMERGMTLKDCSAYNIQFRYGKPVFIDTLSFERYHEGQPWVAYRQFCQHFLAPLSLMSKRDIRLNQLLRIYLDGVPLDLASNLLPLSTRFSFTLLTHIHLHAASQRKYAGKAIDISGRKMPKSSFLGIVDNLKSAISSLRWQPVGTEWADYYEDTNYTAAAFQHKKDIVAGFLDQIKPASVWDMGANDGTFSRLASGSGIATIAFDIDPAAVEKNYLDCNKVNDKNILPLVMDLTNPSGGIGWENRERQSLIERGPADAVLALALVHHLAISNNLPFSRIAGFMSRICTWLIIEFIPKNDSQIKRLLSSREDIFTAYTQQAFEKDFRVFFNILEKLAITESGRVLYLMQLRQP